MRIGLTTPPKPEENIVSIKKLSFIIYIFEGLKMWPMQVSN